MDWPTTHVLVTGGSSGIGAAVADHVARLGATTTLVARGAAQLTDTATRLRAAHPEATVATQAVDVSDRPALEAAIAAAVADQGPIDVLVCSAGITRPGRFVDTDPETFRSIVEVDYFGTLWPIRAVTPSMVARGRGSIVAVASAAALVGVYGYSAYGAAKFAVRGLAESLRTELAPAGVQVSCAFPPDVDTPMLAGEDELKPPATRAIAGTVAPLSAPRVAAAIVAGIERGTPEIYADTPTRVLARTVAWAPGLYRRYFDRIGAKVDRP